MPQPFSILAHFLNCAIMPTSIRALLSRLKSRFGKSKMGGAREDVLQTEKPKAKEGVVIQAAPVAIPTATGNVDLPNLSELGIAKQQLRFHESNNEIHFHDDEAKLKAAVPAAIWYAAWSQLKVLKIKDWNYRDEKNQTYLELFLGKDSDGAAEAQVKLSKIAKFSTGPTFNKLDNFTARR